jgi:hypothetical protein
MPCVKLPSILIPTQTLKSFKPAIFSQPYPHSPVEIFGPGYFQVLCNFERINPSCNLRYGLLLWS